MRITATAHTANVGSDLKHTQPDYNLYSVDGIEQGAVTDLSMITSKVFRAEHRRQVRRSDYGDSRPKLGSENVVFPIIGSKEGSALRLLLSGTLSHRDFDALTHSYRLAIFIDWLRTNGWTIVNHDLAVKSSLGSKATQVSYELYASFEPELKQRLGLFCVAVDQILLGEAM